MEHAFSWIGKIFDFLFSLFPRLLIINAVSQGVKWRHGKHVMKLDPGLHIYLPLVTEVLILACAKQTHPIPSQALFTKDKKKVVISSIVVYEIHDAAEAVGKSAWDLEGNLTDYVQSIVVEVVMSYTLDELIEGLAEGEGSELNQRLTGNVKEAMLEFGVNILRCRITELSQPTVIKIIGDSSWSSGEE